MSVPLMFSPGFSWSSGHGVLAATDVAPWVVIGWVALVAAAVAGVGCLVAVLGALFPRAASACDTSARATSPTAPLLLGSLVAFGAVAVLGGLSHLGPVAAGLALLVVGLPALLALVAGSLATLPLLGERLLGARGPEVSPLRRAVTGSLALGFAAVPGVILQAPFLSLVLATAVIGWPVGVATAAVISWKRGRGRGTTSRGGTAPGEQG